jgi:serine O-acetyltransferase
MHVKGNLPYHLWWWANRLHRIHIPLVPFLLQQVLRIIFCCALPYRTKVGQNVHFSHLGLGIVINPEVVIGNNVKINQHVTLGGNGGGGSPTICDHAYIGAGAKVLGNIRIGTGAKIGANAVVLCDVPDGATAVGVPARILLKKEKPEQSGSQQ